MVRQKGGSDGRPPGEVCDQRNGSHDAERSTEFRTPARNAAMILLSVKAGLRACEIARLDRSMVLTAPGEVGRVLEVRDSIAKRRSGRRIPVHPQLRTALIHLRATQTRTGPIVRSQRASRLQSNEDQRLGCGGRSRLPNRSFKLSSWSAKARRRASMNTRTARSLRRTTARNRSSLPSPRNSFAASISSGVAILRRYCRPG